MSKYTTEQLQEMAQHIERLHPHDPARNVVLCGLVYRLNMPVDKVIANISELAAGRTVH